MTGRLDGDVALVTGAASGIGRAVVARYLDEGVKGVVAVDRDAEALAALSSEFGPSVRVVPGDVTDPTTHAEAVAAACETFGGLDVAVGNAGLFDFHRPLARYAPDELIAAMDEIFAVNVRGYVLLAQAAYPALRQRHGALIFTGSVASVQAGGGGVLYTASKHAVLGVIRRLALEFAPEVRVNGVGPGGTLTGLRGAASLGHGARRLGADPVALAAQIAPTNPLRLAQAPEDHAGLYVLLASRRDARAITGELLMSDGGLGVRPFLPIPG